MVAGASADPAAATFGSTGVAATTANWGVGESMEKMSPAVALPFRIGNCICENPMEITRMELLTGTASLLSDPMADPAGEGFICSSSSSHRHEEAEVMAMIDEAGVGVDLEAQVIAGSDEDEMILTEPGNPLERSCSISPISDRGSICSVAEDFSLLFAVSAAGTTSSVDAVKSVLSSSSESVSCSASTELNVEDVSVVVEADSRFEVLPVIVQVKHEIRAGGASPRSLLGSDDAPLWGRVSICGRRPEMEDAVAVVPGFSEIPLRMLTGARVVDGGLNADSTYSMGHFFGVYDGHGGAQVANYCRERLHMSLIEEIRNIQEDLGGSTLGDHQKRWESAFMNCFSKVDAEIQGRGNSGSDASLENCGPTSAEPIAPETVGSTAVVAVLCSAHIIIANCGDSRALLCRGKRPLPLSVDHKPNREDEYARIEAAGGKVIQWNGYRVFGVLAMSRSIGDRYLKPWIIPEPEVTCTPRMKEDECLVLASDGLWDVVSNEEVCDFARRRILQWHKKNGVTSSAERGEGADPAAQSAAEYLSRLALQRGSKDNITVIVIDLKAHRRFKTRT